tara:strand:+ start:247 stop:606 length:360 start_codon:yes stop_codon:yes gene_type:complete
MSLNGRRICDVYWRKAAVVSPGSAKFEERVQRRIIITRIYDEADVINKAQCKYEGGTMSDGCSPKEVDYVYKKYLEEIGKVSTYDCTEPLAMGEIGRGICFAKRVLKQIMNNEGWIEIS